MSTAIRLATLLLSAIAFGATPAHAQISISVIGSHMLIDMVGAGDGILISSNGGALVYYYPGQGIPSAPTFPGVDTLTITGNSAGGQQVTLDGVLSLQGGVTVSGVETLHYAGDYNVDRRLLGHRRPGNHRGHRRRLAEPGSPHHLHERQRGPHRADDLREQRDPHDGERLDPADRDRGYSTGGPGCRAECLHDLRDHDRHHRHRRERRLRKHGCSHLRVYAERGGRFPFRGGHGRKRRLSNIGVHIREHASGVSPSLSATGNGSVTVTGTGGSPATGSNFGFKLGDCQLFAAPPGVVENCTIATVDGDIVIRAFAGGGANSEALATGFGPTAFNATGAGSISFAMDSMAFTTYPTVSTANNVTITSATPSTPIQICITFDCDFLAIHIFASKLIIGDTQHTGGIQVAGAPLLSATYQLCRW
jgi:hypothetical protein